MSNVSISTDMAQEKLYAATKVKPQQEQQSEQDQNQVLHDPNQATGLQWTAQQGAAAQAAQNQPQVGKTNAKAAPKIEIALPDIDDLATLSTTVSMKSESVKAPKPRGLMDHIRDSVNLGALEESYREIFKKSKSHNLLLERFFSKTKLAVIQGMMTSLGVSTEKLRNIQAECRQEALKEIELKLSQDWAYTKAMIDITTGKSNG